MMCKYQEAKILKIRKVHLNPNYFEVFVIKIVAKIELYSQKLFLKYTNSHILKYYKSFNEHKRVPFKST